MKNLTYGLLIFCLSLFVMQACKKSGITIVKGQISATQLTLDLNQPDTLILGGAVKDSVQWSTTPSSATTVRKFKNTVILKFSTAGTYSVSANTDNGVTASISITVTNTPYVPNPIYTMVTYDPAEQITLVPKLVVLNGSKTMYFEAQFSKIYACSNSIPMLIKSVNGNNLNINFTGVEQPDPGSCQVANAPFPSENLYFFQTGSGLPFTPGTYPLTVTLNNITYTGSIVITTTDMTFNWNYTSDVIITSGHLSL